MNSRHPGLLVCLNHGLLSLRIGLLLHQLLPLFGHLERSFLGLNLFVIVQDLPRYSRLGHAYGNNFETRSKDVDVALQCFRQDLIQSIKRVDVDFLQRVLTAKLVNFMMNFVIDPSSIIMDRVILHNGMCRMPMELINHLDSIERNDGTPAGSTGNLSDLVGLDCNLDGVMLGNERRLPVKPRIGDSVEEGPTSVVHSDVALRNPVQPNSFYNFQIDSQQEEDVKDANHRRMQRCR
mmetsp:Transcript_645/g.1082  ORF Transcript_645/g.1082 Transcript_645/m.1082 type:complete len:236 (-) Transcript_645:124-831(-)